MDANEETYLTQFRELADRRRKIEAMIAELECICGSLKNWQETAAQLGELGSSQLRQEWSDDRLDGLKSLRNHMVQFHRGYDQLLRTWSAMCPLEKIGFSQPAALKQPRD